MIKNRRQGSVGLAGADQDSHHTQLTRCGLVDQVRHHGVALAIESLFTGRMKMELKKIVGLVANGQLAACRHVHLHGMAIVPDDGRAGLVVKLKRRQRHLVSFDDVDRALMLPQRTFLECRVNLGPMGCAVLTFVLPVGSHGLLAR